MDQRTRPAAPPLYETFDPQTDLVAEEDSVTFLFHLPEFRKEQLKVQLSSSRVLRISGERPLGDNKWKRFVKEVRVPEVCDTKGIVAKFDGGILYVKQPKMVIPAAEPQPNPTPVPVPAPAPAPSNTPETEKMGEELRKEGEEADQTTMEGAKEEQRKSLDEHGGASGDADNADFTKKTEEETAQDEVKGSYGVSDEHGRDVVRGGQFEETMLKKNLWNLLLIAILVVALLVRMIYT